MVRQIFVHLLCHSHSSETDILKKERHMNEISKISVTTYARISVSLKSKEKYKTDIRRNVKKSFFDWHISNE